MNRRAFITLLGSAAVWPMAARAQQPERMRRIGVLTSLAADDPQTSIRDAAFWQVLQELGWTSDATCASNIDGARAIPGVCANTQRNWSRLRRTSFWLPAARPS